MAFFNSSTLDSPIEYLKGVGPIKAEILKEEAKIFKFKDLIEDFPFRYVDKTNFYLIKDITQDGITIQLKGTLVSFEKIKGKNNRHRLVGLFKDSSGFMELVWFQSVKFLEKSLKPHHEYTIYGRISIYDGKKSMVHPEMELTSERLDKKGNAFQPVYHSTDKLNARGLDSKNRRKLIQRLFEKLGKQDFPENLPEYITKKMRLASRHDAYKWIHFPENIEQKQWATQRLKFEEFFFLQLKLLTTKIVRKSKLKGAVFQHIGQKFNEFYHNKLNFELTGAQKRVLKEIRHNTGSGIQMNRLLQGDVGSGKTIVGLMSMLIALDNGFQACLMAPTEILAQQHFRSITDSLEGMNIKVAFLSGTVKGKKRQSLLDDLKDGKIDILIGTHALIEDPVVFKNLGLAITDEQHRFGVAQRSKLWQKNKNVVPHILVMTATPIPRTLAMTVYGDLDVSVIDELPPGRKEIQTLHKREKDRSRVIEFMHKQIARGRQIYVVFPLIEESAKLDLKNLNDGYERLLHYFPRPDFQMSIVHGRMKSKDKDLEMQRFVEGKTQIMVATTVIEVGVNVPNASVMIIENTERFGLSQLHQLRGRVGRGGEQSFCLLMSSDKLSKDAKERIQTMVRTTNGFEIAEADMNLRGPGNMQGTQQSGVLDFKLINLVQDTGIIETARNLAQKIIDTDPNLEHPSNIRLKRYLERMKHKIKDWGRIS